MKDQHGIWYLESLDVSGILCPKKLEMSKHGLKHTQYKRGEYIYMSQENADVIYFINSGRVKIGSYDSDSNKEVTKAILREGEVFGELVLAGQSKRQDFAMAMEPTELCEIHRDMMDSLLKDHSGLSMFFMKLLGSRALRMEQRLESLVFKDSRSRIIEFLIDLVDRRGERVGYEYVVRKFITHQEIANLTATSRQTVTTILNELRAENLLTFDRRRLLVRDLQKLKAEVHSL